MGSKEAASAQVSTSQVRRNARMVGAPSIPSIGSAKDQLEMIYVRHRFSIGSYDGVGRGMNIDTATIRGQRV